MFKSKQRRVVIPQSEHARLAGIFASLWGNDAFDRPAFDFPSYVLGVTMHDRGYGQFDDSAIGEMSEETWLRTQEAGIVETMDNPIVEIVCLLHIRRLLGYDEEPENEPLIEQATAGIDLALKKTDHPLAAFQWADRITRLCDSMAFSFSFEEAETVQRPICPRVTSDDTVSIDFTLDGTGTITADPWPFSVTHYAGFIIGYELDDYPARLEPVYVPFVLKKGEA